jgi:hypothetical protein
MYDILIIHFTRLGGFLICALHKIMGSSWLKEGCYFHHLSGGGCGRVSFLLKLAKF